jgi:hypothetical protein
LRCRLHFLVFHNHQLSFQKVALEGAMGIISIHSPPRAK